MTNRYIEDLQAQPAAMRATLESLSPTSPSLRNVAALWASRSWSRIVLTGMGASFSALMPLHYMLAQAGLPVMSVEASELLHYQLPLITPDTLLVIASQSGSSVEIVMLLEATSGISRVAITNTPDSPLALQADVVLLTQAGDEYTVGCKTFVTTIAAGLLLGAQISAPAELPAVHASLKDASDKMAEFLSDLFELRDQYDTIIGEAKPLIVTGRGSSMAATTNGALVIKESTKYHAHGMSVASFCHGPFEIVREGITVLVFQGAKKTVELNRRLARDVVAAGGRAVWIGCDAPQAEGVQWIKIPQVDEIARPLVEILPMHVLSLTIAKRIGFEAGKFLHGGKVTTVE